MDIYVVRTKKEKNIVIFFVIVSVRVYVCVARQLHVRLSQPSPIWKIHWIPSDCVPATQLCDGGVQSE